MKAFELYENVDVMPIGIFASVTAGGAGDNAEVTGTSVDLRDVHDAVICVHSLCTLAASETLALTVKIQESDDDSTFDTAETLATAVVVKTGAVTDGEDVYQLKLDLHALKNRKRYAKFLVTPNLSASATDTATIRGFLLTGGARVKPITHT